MSGKDKHELTPEEEAALRAAMAAEQMETAEDAEPEEAAAPDGTDGPADGAQAETETETEDSGAQPKEAGNDKNDKTVQELKDRLLRNMAEFDNYRKRTEKEKASMFDLGAGSILTKILPTVDNFERGLRAKPEDEASKAFVEGMEMIYRDFLKSLEDAGLKPIEALGQQFDPNLHNAVMHEEDDSGEENIVTEEFQKGYTFKDSVIRHSMVKVKN